MPRLPAQPSFRPPARPRITPVIPTPDESEPVDEPVASWERPDPTPADEHGIDIIDPVKKANIVAGRREEISREEAETRLALEEERDRLRARLGDVEAALVLLGGKPGAAEERQGAVPDRIRAILRQHPEGLTAVRIAEIAREQGRPLESTELHPALSRIVSRGEIVAEGEPRRRVYTLAKLRK